MFDFEFEGKNLNTKIVRKKNVKENQNGESKINKYYIGIHLYISIEYNEFLNKRWKFLKIAIKIKTISTK
jgi:hypothetical protein